MQDTQNPDKEIQPLSWKDKLRTKSLKNQQAKLNKAELSRKKKSLANKIKTLQMDMLDMDLVNSMVKQRMVPVLKKADMSKHGTKKMITYYESLSKAEIIKTICRKNGWTNRQDWQDHGVPINAMFKDLFDSAVSYSEIKMYFDKLKYDQFARLHRR